MSAHAGLAQPSSPEQTIPLHEREHCDRCNAKAYVEVLLRHGTLAFCGHHFYQHETPLREVGVIRDFRAALTDDVEG